LQQARIIGSAKLEELIGFETTGQETQRCLLSNKTVKKSDKVKTDHSGIVKGSLNENQSIKLAIMIHHFCYYINV
jgi:hypothetical protein